MATKVSGVSIALTPPTIAISISPRLSAETASWSATNDEEHAVSIVMLGPRRSNTNETRFDSMVYVPLVAV